MSDVGSLPLWAKTLQRRIRQRGIDLFILHGPGVRELHPLGARLAELRAALGKPA
jgi:hypothetical protein